MEKKLGITGKQQIEEQVGIAEFTRLCRESVYSYVDEFARLTTRIGYWVDMDEAYWTLSPTYIESVWWHLQQLFDQGLLYEDLKVVPYCPRCGTALSSHELGQPDVYRDEEDESAYVRLRLVDPDPAVVGEAAVARRVDDHAVDPAVEHRRGGEPRPDLRRGRPDARGRRAGGRRVRGGRVAPGSRRRVPGAALVGLRYERPFDDLDPPHGADGWRVVPGRLRHDRGGHRPRAPGPGLRRGRPPDRPRATACRPSTRSVPTGASPTDIEWLAGRDVREANHDINDRLEAAGLLIRRFPYVHSYPHCWRCRTPLIYWGKPSWYIATSTRKDDLLAANATVDWHPAHIRDGRFGEWLANNVDWALSRDRYWGTPLPIWRCGRGHLRCVGSLAELSDLCGRDVTGIDPHRPTIDEVTFVCSTCAGRGRRRRARAWRAGSSR